MGRRSLVWILLAGLIGFLVPAVFSTGLRWPRSLFLVPYVVLVGGFLAMYFRATPVTLRQLIGHWPYGLIGVTVASFFLVKNIQGQPPSAVPQGGQLTFAIAWFGVMYGMIDGLLLNVMPVLAVQGPPLPAVNLPRRPQLARGVLALVASVFVTVAYHLGYAEFQGRKVVSVIIGNIIITATYVLTGSPLAAVATHVIMHVTAVMHGMETTLQLPPHYTP
jgi:hypothetical protein